MTPDAIRAFIVQELQRVLVPHQTQAPEVLSAEQAAQFLGVDRKTIYDYANRGQLPHRRIGKRLLFSRSALVAWLEPCKSTSTRKG